MFSTPPPRLSLAHVKGLDNPGDNQQEPLHGVVGADGAVAALAGGVLVWSCSSSASAAR
jgi:hypothetical protein